MSFKISWPFGEKHPVLAAVLIALLEVCLVWSIWYSLDRGVVGGRHQTDVYNRPGIGLFEILLAVRVVGAACLLALMFMVVRDAIKNRARKGS